MPRFVDEVELVVTNNLARARARLSSSESVDLNAEDHPDYGLGANNLEEAEEDDHLLSPSKARNRYSNKQNSTGNSPSRMASRR